MNITLSSVRLKTTERNHRLMRVVFTEVINQVRQKFIFPIDLHIFRLLFTATCWALERMQAWDPFAINTLMVVD